MKKSKRTQHRRVRKPRKALKKHPNPVKRSNKPRLANAMLFADPIFLHHLCGAIFRALEVTMPGKFDRSLHIDAEFVPPLNPFPKNKPTDVCANCGITRLEGSMEVCLKDSQGIHVFRPAPLPPDNPKS